MQSYWARGLRGTTRTGKQSCRIDNRPHSETGQVSTGYSQTYTYTQTYTTQPVWLLRGLHFYTTQAEGVAWIGVPEKWWEDSADRKQNYVTSSLWNSCFSPLSASTAINLALTCSTFECYLAIPSNEKIKTLGAPVRRAIEKQRPFDPCGLWHLVPSP